MDKGYKAILLMMMTALACSQSLSIIEGNTQSNPSLGLPLNSQSQTVEAFLRNAVSDLKSNKWILFSSTESQIVNGFVHCYRYTFNGDYKSYCLLNNPSQNNYIECKLDDGRVITSGRFSPVTLNT